jgi:hypothetical protein
MLAITSAVTGDDGARQTATAAAAADKKIYQSAAGSAYLFFCGARPKRWEGWGVVSGRNMNKN